MPTSCSFPTPPANAGLLLRSETWGTRLCALTGRPGPTAPVEREDLYVKDVMSLGGPTVHAVKLSRAYRRNSKAIAIHDNDYLPPHKNTYRRPNPRKHQCCQSDGRTYHSARCTVGAARGRCYRVGC